MAKTNTNFDKLNNCVVYRDELIEDYLFGTLPENEQELFEKHFFGCDECRNHLAYRVALKESLQHNESLPNDLQEMTIASKVIKIPTLVHATTEAKPTYHALKYLSLALLIVSMLGVALVINYYYFNDSRLLLGENTEPLRGTEGENFRPSPFLESQIRMQHRQNQSVATVSPRPDFIYTGKMYFKWKVLDKEKRFSWDDYKVIVLNSKELKVFDEQLKSNEFLYRGHLPQGVYYWLLESEYETMMVGRFYVLTDQGRE